MSNTFIFTSESVTEGHPDKIADQISDTVLDEFLKKDSEAKVACETLIKNNLIVLAGEINSKANIDYYNIVKKKMREIGYVSKETGFDIEQCSFIVNINRQSQDIAKGIKKKKQGAGDQGLMFGYATNETKTFMPMPIALAHSLSKKLAEVRKKGIIDYLQPDGKTQVSVNYKGKIPESIHTVVVSSQHKENIAIKKIIEDIKNKVIFSTIPKELITKKTKFFINPTGIFVKGGPEADAGLTGRKIIVDTYGGMGRHGGGAFSGKDPSKVDRSAAYAARYIAKNMVAAGLFDECEIQLSYAIGVDEPVSININSFNTEKNQINYKKLIAFIYDYFPLKPAEIINYFKLKRPIYSATSCYGHFGKNQKELTWEKIDFAPKIKAKFK